MFPAELFRPCLPTDTALSPSARLLGLTHSQPQMATALHASIQSVLILKAPVFQALSSWSLCSGKNNTPKQPGIYLICCP